MTARSGNSVRNLVCWATLAVLCALAAPLEAQRQRAPSSQDGEGVSRTAQEREAPPARSAQQRESVPAPEAPPPAPAAPAPAPATEPSRPASSERNANRDHDDDRGRRDRAEDSGPAVARPAVIAPRPAIERTIITPTLIVQPRLIERESVTFDREALEGRRNRGGSSPSPAVIVVHDLPVSEADWDVVDVVPSTVDRNGVATISESPATSAMGVPRPAPIPFMPWYSVNETIAAGFPVPYPEPYANTYDRARFTNSLDGTGDSEPILPPGTAIVPGAPLVPYAIGTFGGLTFDVSPGDVQVYVDGLFVGTTDDFVPDGPPLPLPARTHKIQLRMRGYRTEAFEVMVPLGQVMPLSGALVAVRER